MAFNPRFGVGPFVSVSYGTVVPVVPATHYVVANPVIVSGPRLKKKPYYDMNDKAPSTTVFVGNIHEKANNDLMRSLLLKCGNIAQWKRVHGTNGRIQAFGFCEFDHPDATLRAVRLLNNLNLGGKKLLIKCDEKTQTTIKEYINKRRTIYGKAPLNLEKVEDIPVEEYFHDKDSSQFHRECRQLVATANEPDLLLEELPGDSKFPSNANLTSQLIIPETEEADKDKLGLIEREIKQFRSTHKDEKIKSRHRRSSRSPKKKDSSSDVVKQETSVTTAANEKENSRPTATSTTDGVGKTSPVSSRASSKTRDRRGTMTANGKRSRSRETPRVASKRRTTRSRSKSKSKRRDSEDEEDMRIRSRLERKIREKEYAYQERLQKWETRERKKKREYEKDRHNEKQKRKEELREAKKLKEFFEDYDDDTEDPKYYKGKSYEIRRRDYDHEIELDARDRQKEREELEEIRRRLLSEGVENPDVEILRIQRAQEERLLKRLRADSGSESPLVSSTPAASIAASPKTAPPRRTRRDSAASNETESSLLADGAGAVESTTDQQMEAVVKSWQTMKEETTTVVDGRSSTPGSVGQASGQKAASFGFAGLKISGRGTAHASSSSLLPASAGGASVAADGNDNDDDSSLTSKRQRPLVKLEYSEAEKQALEDQQPSLNVANMTVEEKRKAIKNLIEKIPTNREELFAYAINWPLVDQILIEKRLKPWVSKKIVEYIGEEEPSLVEFICQKVAEKCPPQTILEDISMVLDEEASVFVIKLWRLLIYEIEAKRFGLVKLD